MSCVCILSLGSWVERNNQWENYANRIFVIEISWVSMGLWKLANPNNPKNPIFWNTMRNMAMEPSGPANPKIQSGPPEGRWNHRENPKNPKNPIFWHTIRHMAHETPWAICLIVGQKIGFFRFLGFSQWFHLPSGGPHWILGFASPLWFLAKHIDYSYIFPLVECFDPGTRFTVCPSHKIKCKIILDKR